MPHDKGEPTTMPHDKGKPTTMPNDEGKPTTMPYDEGKPTTMPNDEGEPTTAPRRGRVEHIDDFPHNNQPKIGVRDGGEYEEEVRRAGGAG